MSNVIEVLYYKLYNSVLLSKKEDAKFYLALLRNEYEINAKEFEVLKKDERWDHLIELGNSIDKNKFLKTYEIPNNDEVISGDCEITKYERELVDEICRDQSIIRKALNASEDFYLSNKEHKTIYGKVDLVGDDKDIKYVIEVKNGVAKHGVVSQIDKYLIDFKLKLILKMYNKISDKAFINEKISYLQNVISNNVYKVYNIFHTNFDNFIYSKPHQTDLGFVTQTYIEELIPIKQTGIVTQSYINYTDRYNFQDHF